MQCANAYTTAQTVTGLLQETTDAQCGHETKPTATQAYIQPTRSFNTLFNTIMCT